MILFKILIIAVVAFLWFLIVACFFNYWRITGWDEPKDPAWGLKHPRTPKQPLPSELEAE